MLMSPTLDREGGQTHNSRVLEETRHGLNTRYEVSKKKQNVTCDGGKRGPYRFAALIQV